MLDLEPNVMLLTSVKFIQDRRAVTGKDTDWQRIDGAEEEIQRGAEAKIKRGAEEGIKRKQELA
jgi:hypothetical protein